MACLAAPIVFATKPVQFKLCDQETSSFHVSSLSISPNPPITGQNATIQLRGDITHTILPGSSFTVKGYAGPGHFVRVYNEHFDICAEGASSGFPCPVMPGQGQEWKLNVAIPPGLPTFVSVKLYIQGQHESGEELMCGEAMVHFAKP